MCIAHTHIQLHLHIYTFKYVYMRTYIHRNSLSLIASLPQKRQQSGVRVGDLQWIETSELKASMDRCVLHPICILTTGSHRFPGYRLILTTTTE